MRCFLLSMLIILQKFLVLMFGFEEYLWNLWWTFSIDQIDLEFRLLSVVRKIVESSIQSTSFDHKGCFEHHGCCQIVTIIGVSKLQLRNNIFRSKYFIPIFLPTSRQKVGPRRRLDRSFRDPFGRLTGFSNIVRFERNLLYCHISTYIETQRSDIFGWKYLIKQTCESLFSMFITNLRWATDYCGELFLMLLKPTFISRRWGTTAGENTSA